MLMRRDARLLDNIDPGNFLLLEKVSMLRKVRKVAMSESPAGMDACAFSHHHTRRSRLLQWKAMTTAIYCTKRKPDKATS